MASGVLSFAASSSSVVVIGGSWGKPLAATSIDTMKAKMLFERFLTSVFQARTSSNHGG
jgi:hypothetical protein